MAAEPDLSPNLAHDATRLNEQLDPDVASLLPSFVPLGKAAPRALCHVVPTLNPASDHCAHLTHPTCHLVPLLLSSAVAPTILLIHGPILNPKNQPLVLHYISEAPPHGLPYLHTSSTSPGYRHRTLISQAALLHQHGIHVPGDLPNQM
jgi:hypothetical protein